MRAVEMCNGGDSSDACRHRRTSHVVELLLLAGADVFARDATGYNAFNLAAQDSTTAVLRMVLHLSAAQSSATVAASSSNPQAAGILDAACSGSSAATASHAAFLAKLHKPIPAVVE